MNIDKDTLVKVIKILWMLAKVLVNQAGINIEDDEDGFVIFNL